jgi:protein-disulfide isomerase
MRVFIICIAALSLWIHPRTAAAEGSAPSAGIPAGFTAAGEPYLGAAAASVTLTEYSDYLCPFCGRHFDATYPEILKKYVRDGRVRMVFRDLPLASLHPTAARGHIAARCVGRELDASAYWRMHDALFARRAEWNQLPEPDAFLQKLGAELGARRMAACMRDPAVAAAVQASVAQAAQNGFTSTPTFVLSVVGTTATYTVTGAQPLASFEALLDALTTGRPVPTATPARPAELPKWANTSGLQPDPNRPGWTSAGDAYTGSTTALLTVVEFSDYQCPSCAQHALEVQPEVDRRYVSTGKVRWVHKHAPLAMHPQAVAAAVAAECAGEQGRYWQMHAALFQTVDQWAVEKTDAALNRVATALKPSLDLRRFARCLDSRAAAERVIRDLYDGQGPSQTTPMFVFLYNGQGTIVRGARPAADFTALVDRFLTLARPPQP